MDTKKKPLKMYVLVRNDLEVTYRGVQGIHAVAAFYEKGNVTAWHNETIAQLGIRNEKDLRYWAWKLQTKNKQFAVFYEPDMSYQMTAIACVDTGEIFKNLQLSR
jgi:hypothetical protein